MGPPVQVHRVDLQALVHVADADTLAALGDDRPPARRPRGRPIIALPSTALGGRASRIVSQLARGAGVVTTRGDVHFVVTEFGVAALHGRTVRERAQNLVRVAAPQFRDLLCREALETYGLHLQA
ncbi:MAG: hypothetical protein FJ037_03435 [Chloroflexi bacterium]|nr:hypothetical protein [Chloroflexota bacterium]